MLVWALQNVSAYLAILCMLMPVLWSPLVILILGQLACVCILFSQAS
jgi:hypothetical protein